MRPTGLEPWRLVALLVLSTLCAPGAVCAESGDTTADRVLGQGSLTAGQANAVDASGVAAPFAVAVDTSVIPNRVYVADPFNSRVLAWADAEAFRNGAPADLVLGQADPFASDCHPASPSDPGPGTLCQPRGLAVDAAGNLWVADTGNHRVLEFDSPFSTDVVPDRLFSKGPPAGPAGRCGDRTDGSFCSPTGVAIDRAGTLVVADSENCRILLFAAALARPAGDTRADLVLGATAPGPDPCGNECSKVDGLCTPTEVAIDPAGNLWVTTGTTVLGFDAPLTTDALADRSLGFSSFQCERETPTRASLCRPAGADVDARGTLWVADQGYNRVLGFDAPLTTDAVADHVLGQGGSFESGVCTARSARSLCSPADVAVDGAGRLWVADSGNSRVLRFNAPRAQQAAARQLGQPSFRTREVNRLDARGLFLPASVAIDRSVSPNRLWIADTDNDRVLGWRDAALFGNGAPADLVLGQPDPFSSGCNTGGLSARSLCRPRGLAVDAAGTLWVADFGNHRVLAFRAPFATDATADLVLGQGGSFTSANCFNGGRSAASLCQPRDVAVDRRSNLYVADFQRVLQFDQPLRRGTTADRLFGQPSFQAGGCDLSTLARTLCDPFGVEVDAAGTLWVVDLPTSRILGYRNPLGRDTRPDVVLGQHGSFRTGDCNQGGRGPETLCFPNGIAATADGDLYVADRENNRVLRIESPGNRPRVTQVFGQDGNFTSSLPNLGGLSADSLLVPQDVAVDEEGSLYIADSANHRVLVYDEP